jgi:hypothetical protein
MLESNNTRPWFRDEILRILIGINLSSRASTTLDKNATDFRRGFTLALASVAIVVGIRPEHILNSDDLVLLETPSGREPGD